MLPEDAPKTAKPRTGSLFKTMSLDTVTLDDALRLLTLPRVVGDRRRRARRSPRRTAATGPYLKKGTDSRSLETEEQLLHGHPRRGAGDLRPAQAARPAAPRPAPLRELGTDPVTGKPVVVKDGRFGAYVTDGETNATLRKGDTVETVTIERALGAARREARRQGTGPRSAAAKARQEDGAKKTATKKTAAKKAAASKTGQEVGADGASSLRWTG